MKSDQYWDSLTNFCKQFRNFADDVWKVWRYFGVAAVAGIAYDVGGHPAALAFSGLATGIGILCLITWLLPGMINGLTEKGRNAGPVWKAGLTVTFLYTVVYFAVSIWVLVTTIALPALR
ncbi:hypothetical protein [Brucella oryzae]